MLCHGVLCIFLTTPLPYAAVAFLLWPTTRSSCAMENSQPVRNVPQGNRSCPYPTGIWAVLPQSCIFEAKCENRVSKNQWLASLNFPVFGNLRRNSHAPQEHHDA